AEGRRGRDRVRGLRGRAGRWPAAKRAVLRQPALSPLASHQGAAGEAGLESVLEPQADRPPALPREIPVRLARMSRELQRLWGGRVALCPPYDGSMRPERAPKRVSRQCDRSCRHLRESKSRRRLGGGGVGTAGILEQSVTDRNEISARRRERVDVLERDCVTYAGNLEHLGPPGNPIDNSVARGMTAGRARFAQHTIGGTCLCRHHGIVAAVKAAGANDKVRLERLQGRS